MFPGLLLIVLVMTVCARCTYVLGVRFTPLSGWRANVASAVLSLVVWAVCMFWGNMFLGYYLHILVVFFITDIFILITRIPAISRINPERLRYFKPGYTAFVLVCALVMTVFGYFNATEISVKQYNISMEQSPAKPVRIMFFSDLHLNDSNIDRVISGINSEFESENPDIVIVGGDLLDNSSDLDNLYEICRTFERITKKSDVLFVYGNHDLMPGDGIDTAKIRTCLSDAGVKVLEDADYTKYGICFVGRKEKTSERLGTGREDIGKLMPTDESVPVVVIDHQPTELERLGRLGVDLSLSGHTHNGQIFPFGYICELFGINELQYGMRKSGAYSAIVSSGISTWGMNVRTQGQCEILIIDIK